MSNATLILHPILKQDKAQTDVQARLEEAKGLADAISLEVMDAWVVTLAAIRPATLFGKGKVEEIAEHIKAQEIELVIVDGALSPVQQRNLEKSLACKVIDRTALILEIFGARARTAEGKLQVELAALNYQKTRLVRSWTHLERQRGGFGFMGGPGESQIELDRRMISERIIRLKKDLEKVQRTRGLHRKSRRDVPYPIVALVGYTNAGKSTLFNRLTGASVMAQDKLFATLDPTMRAVTLPSKLTIILSDTVGFISDLPHELVAAFRATLVEVLEADLLLHIRDISHEDSEPQKHEVEQVLLELFERDTLPEHVIEVGNKADLLICHPVPEQALACKDQTRDPVKTISARLAHNNFTELAHELCRSDNVLISALTGEGIPALLTRIDVTLTANSYEEVSITLPASDGKTLAWLHEHGQILKKTLEDDVWHLSVRVPRAKIRKLQPYLQGIRE